MSRTLHQFFENDHRRIDVLLNKATENPNKIDTDYYHQFRTQLLRHIKMEENILFPAAKKANPAVMKELLPQFRLEHGAITALMVPPPTPTLVKVIRYLLHTHNMKEEDDQGLYDICESLTKEKTQELLDQLIATEEVPLHPPNSAPIAIEAAKRALIRAGYDYDEIVKLTK
ncbi:MAG: hemerythrin domain-containing protein [Flavobacteriales bacterium]|nr:hemerythrin domain-containing protein [Flavobacteriales bacterium]